MKSICLLSHNLGGNGCCIAHLLGSSSAKTNYCKIPPFAQSFGCLFAGILLVFGIYGKIIGILDIIRTRLAGFHKKINLECVSWKEYRYALKLLSLIFKNPNVQIVLER